MNQPVRYGAATLLALLSLLPAATSRAAIVFSEDFNSYAAGNLVGQGGWVQLGASAVNPVQVDGTKVVNMSTDQDVQKPFSSVVSRSGGEANGESITAEFDVNLSSSGNDDFFAHISVSPGNTTFFNRFYTQAGSAAGTFNLGLAASAPSGGVVNLNYGGDLNIGQTYRVKSIWTFVPGASNDILSLSVDGASYIAPFAWDSGTGEPNNLGVFNLRQAAGNAAGVASIDNIVVEHVVPEPATLALAAVCLGIVAARRR
jgi:hypothetical protein